MIYTVTLNPAIDYVVQLENRLHPGCINRSTKEVCQFGGKGINVSTVLQTLGHPSVALGFVAGFTGSALENGLQANGLTTRFIHLEQGMTRINVKVKGQEETEINGMGPAIPEEAMEKLYLQLDALCAGDVLVLSGSIPGCLPSNTYEAILSRLQNRDILTVVDAAGLLLTKALPYKPFLIKPNRQELETIFGMPCATDEDLLACCQQLQKAGGKNILVSLAEDGALLLDEAGMVHRIQAPSGTVVNSVGAGDSMVAGFLAGYLQTGEFTYALRLGTAAGSATAFSLGLATKESIDAQLAQL